MDPPDHALLQQTHIARDQIRRYREGYRKTSEGHATDIVLISRSWGFDIREVRQPVHIWHGTRDTVIPLAAVKHLVAATPQPHVHYLDDTGHLVLERADCWEDVLRLVLDVVGANRERLAEIGSGSKGEEEF